jgi:hypothetical protein
MQIATYFWNRNNLPSNVLLPTTFFHLRLVFCSHNLIQIFEKYETTKRAKILKRFAHWKYCCFLRCEASTCGCFVSYLKMLSVLECKKSRMKRWLNECVTEWLGDWMREWKSDGVNKCRSNKMVDRLSHRVKKWRVQYNRATEWQDD